MKPNFIINFMQNYKSLLLSDVLILKCYFLRVVEFSSESDMRRAVDKLDNTELNGKKIKLVEERRGGGGGGGGSRRRWVLLNHE